MASPTAASPWRFVPWASLLRVYALRSQLFADEAKTRFDHKQPAPSLHIAYIHPTRFRPHAILIYLVPLYVFRACPGFLPSRGRNMTGNRCGHDPKPPKLSPAKPIRKGKGGLPRILSLAVERAKAWYYHPKKCNLLQSHPHRKTRSERREACQIVIETILSHQ